VEKISRDKGSESRGGRIKAPSIYLAVARELLSPRASLENKQGCPSAIGDPIKSDYIFHPRERIRGPRGSIVRCPLSIRNDFKRRRDREGRRKGGGLPPDVFDFGYADVSLRARDTRLRGNASPLRIKGCAP